MSNEAMSGSAYTDSSPDQSSDELYQELLRVQARLPRRNTRITNEQLKTIFMCAGYPTTSERSMGHAGDHVRGQAGSIPIRRYDNGDSADNNNNNNHDSEVNRNLAVADIDVNSSSATIPVMQTRDNIVRTDVNNSNGLYSYSDIYNNINDIFIIRYVYKL